MGQGQGINLVIVMLVKLADKSQEIVFLLLHGVQTADGTMFWNNDFGLNVINNAIKHFHLVKGSLFTVCPAIIAEIYSEVITSLSTELVGDEDKPDIGFSTVTNKSFEAQPRQRTHPALLFAPTQSILSYDSSFQNLLVIE